ncbi:hypothetical protein EKN56_03125 [Limnobaculum zhutongyuii]|uniref:Uncharacterized protein n=1 Tax=Limnobaculum zhutongyuii TaxID=2498113 RepID=A0A411WGW2_9GAMM|nr:hypothetical protein [Limnobaculum zhutongyuii]QBH95485.1 hypothetical protein EKN56_03125 [Limnobaculum zhutongyuii]TQS88826.1 hypothetical protein ELQ32_09470 [Limnobaculum zhutongyuii]
MTNPKSKEQAAARKRRHRERQRQAFGQNRVELVLSTREKVMLQEGCRLRNIGGEPYSITEYISLLIICDYERLHKQLATLGRCPNCDSTLPEGCGGVFKGDSQCFHTRNFRALNLTNVTGHANLEGDVL